MADIEAVWAAVDGLVARVAALDPEVRARYAIERSVSCKVYDLDVVFVGRISEDGLSDVHTDEADKAQVRLSCSSDDLIALIDNRLAAPAAFATGRLRVQAGPMDLLRLRQLF